MTLDRAAQHNAFNSALTAELTTQLTELDQHDAICAIVLTGAGRTFCAGIDRDWLAAIVQASESDNRTTALALAKLLHTLNFLSKPTVARVNGAAYDMGIGLIACCDIAIGVRNAKFAFTDVKLGLVPAMTAPYVVAAIGSRQARRLFVNGETTDGTEMERKGLLHHAVSANELNDTVERTLHFLGKGEVQAQRQAKLLALRVAGITPASASELDADNAQLFALRCAGRAGREGIRAFLDHRRPTWTQ